MKKNTVWLYVIFIFVVQLPALFLKGASASNYMSAAIISMGLAAIVIQKCVHRAPFLDLGFRLNRNAAIGVMLGVFYTAAMLLIFYLLP